MKVKAILLALLSGFVFSAAAQEYQPQVGFSTEKGYKTNFKKNKAGDNWFISIAGGASMLFGDENGNIWLLILISCGMLLISGLLTMKRKCSV